MPDEEEVLFNPLNTFLINKIEKTIIKSPYGVLSDREIDTVYLTYGPLAHIRSMKNPGNAY